MEFTKLDSPSPPLPGMIIPFIVISLVGLLCCQGKTWATLPF